VSECGDGAGVYADQDVTCQKEAGHDGPTRLYRRHRWDGFTADGRPVRILWGHALGAGPDA
jgi:hypothetical protein